MTGIDTGEVERTAKSVEFTPRPDMKHRVAAAAMLLRLADERDALREKLEAAEAERDAYRDGCSKWIGKWAKADDRAVQAEAALTEARAAQAAAWDALETLQFIRDSISDSITSNEEPTHRIELDGVWHTGPVVDWAHKVLTGLRDISGHVLSKHRALTPPADLAAALQRVRDEAWNEAIEAGYQACLACEGPLNNAGAAAMKVRALRRASTEDQ